ncbi:MULTISPECIES: hypothetical protein [Salinibacter]|uniref:hypothetical protein n=1 Tax=Salinibacter TaxID=146918 RepID=UPI001ABA812A|nr:MULTISPECIES: hypothetical protein [Salinibacter]
MVTEQSNHPTDSGEGDRDPSIPLSFDPETGSTEVPGRLGYALTTLEIQYLLDKGRPSKAAITSIRQLSKWRKIYGVLASTSLGVVLRPVVDPTMEIATTGNAIATALFALFLALFFLSESDGETLEEEIHQISDPEDIIENLNSQDI